MSQENKQRLLVAGNLISTTHAAQSIPYLDLAEYLRLLARKQKISAVKVSRDWSTTKSVVLLYIKTKDWFELIQRGAV